MRQSLSEKPVAAVLLSIALAVVAIVDQAGPQSLSNHASDVYAQHGKDISAGVVYGLVYGVAALNVLAWLVVLAVSRHRAVATVLGVIGILLSATTGVLLLVTSEYGVRPFPPLWGVLALLPAVAGAVWMWVRSTRGRTAASGRPGAAAPRVR